jgi:hypothetical protein
MGTGFTWRSFDMKRIACIAIMIALSGCTSTKPLSQEEARKTWEQEGRDMGYNETQFAPLWGAAEK